MLYITIYEMNIMNYTDMILKELQTVGVTKRQLYERSLIHQIGHQNMDKLNVGYIT